MTSYVVLMPGDESIWAAASPEHREDTYAKHRTFAEALASRGHKVTGGAELAHSKETRLVRRIGTEITVTEGPYAETVEQLTGFYTIDTDDLDDLLQCVGILAETEDGIEVREALGGADPDSTA